MALLSLKITAASSVAGSQVGTAQLRSVLVKNSQTLGLVLNPGVVGPTGAQGPTGPTGPPGVGANWQGLWSSGTTYALNDGVTGSDGHNYISLTAGNLNHNPTSTTGFWSDLASNIVVSVTDAPWDAKCDARVVTDASIGAGSNQLSSASAAFTSADAGKSVVVQSAGPNVLIGAVGASTPGVLTTTISSVAAGVATLAAAATNAVSGGTAKYGTDDTAAVQAAINAMSTAANRNPGSVSLIEFPQDRAVMVGSMTPASNVMLWMYGCTIHLNTTNATASSSSMMFKPAANVSYSNWHLRGGYFPGTGTEAGISGSQSIMFWSNYSFGGNGSATFTNISVKDAVVTDWATSCWDVRGGGGQIRIQDNVCLRTGCYTGLNTINILTGGAGVNAPDLADVIITGNFLDRQGAEGIAIADATAVSGTLRHALVANNIVNGGNGFNGGSSACIDIEWSTATTGVVKDVVVANNVTSQAGPGTSPASPAPCISALQSPAANNNPEQMDRLLITGNVCDNSVGTGIVTSASHAIIAHNTIQAGSSAGSPTQGILMDAVGTFAATADTNSSTSLTNAAAPAGVVNGSPLTGSGVPAGTFLVSGAGTSTWTISQAATATATGVAITVVSQSRQTQCIHNVIRMPNTQTNPGIFCFGYRDSLIHGNTISTDPGYTGPNSVVGTGILVQSCGWMTVSNNRVYFAPTSGINLTAVNDSILDGNYIYNPSEVGVGSAAGIIWASGSGTYSRIKDNVCIDDRAAHKMVNGISISGAIPTTIDVVGNTSRGATSTTIVLPSGAGSTVRDNTTDVTTWPAATSAPTVGASPFTTTAVTYPTTVAVVGGTVTTVQHNRTGSTTRNLASYGGAAANVTALLAPGDTITVTYTVAPTVNVFPMQ